MFYRRLFDVQLQGNPGTSTRPRACLRFLIGDVLTGRPEVVRDRHCSVIP
jgi:hypothetical protein